MEKLSLLHVEDQLANDRFRQFFLGAQIAAIGGILNLVIFGENLIDRDSILLFRLDLIALIIGLLVTSSLYVFLDHGQYLKAVIIFLWLWSVLMAFSTWFEGGLYGPLILSFPIIFTLASLFTGLGAFLSICGFLSLAVVFMGLNHIYDWYPPPPGMLIDGIPRIISALVLISLSGYICWVFGKLLKSSCEELKQEHQRVLESQKVIKRLADCDALTGLFNRHGAETRYQNLLKKTNFDHEIIIGYFIDLDDFKKINDLFDHHAGDQLLIVMSERLNSLLGKDDFICRFGGDEFVIVLGTSPDFDIDIEGFAANIMKLLVQPHSILGTDARMTASIGITVVRNTQTSFTTLCKHADMAMYKAKHSGKNNYHQYSDELQREYMRNLHILHSLESALSKNLLDVYFQPKINLQTNKAEGAEALLRWNRGNPDGIEPDEFIPIIESTELIHSIGAWVINEACIACKQWHNEGNPLKVAVNISALQLTRSGFYQTVADALENNNLPPAFFEIEITEHSLLQEVPLAAEQLTALKELGVCLTIDDFGTGYSNMGYLTRLKINVLKLDKSFISQVSQSEEHRVVVVAVITMAKVLGMKVVAEGIETEHDREVLLGMGCDLAQGYLWSRAVRRTDFINVINNLSIQHLESP